MHNRCDYQSPQGGGGITDQVKIGNKNITFGHGGRHLAGSGLSVQQVNNAIANDVISRPATNGIVGHGTVTIGSVNIYYDYFTRSDNLIHIGTYYIKP